jgi:hypothetical protein
VRLRFHRDILRHALRLHGRASTALLRVYGSDTVVPPVVDDFVQLTPRPLRELRPGELPVAFKPTGISQQITATQHAQVLVYEYVRVCMCMTCFVCTFVRIFMLVCSKVHACVRARVCLTFACVPLLCSC